MSSDGPIAWLRSQTTPSRIFPLRPYPHPTTVGRADDRDITIPPQSISRCHCTITVSDSASANVNAVAVLRDSSFNGCFVGDDLVRNRAEWLAAGDVVRFGNDKEGFVVETIGENQADQVRRSHDRLAREREGREGGRGGGGDRGGGEGEERERAAGVGTERGERLRSLGDGSPNRSPDRGRHPRDLDGRDGRDDRGGRPAGGGGERDRDPPMPMPEAGGGRREEGGGERRGGGGQAWQVRGQGG